MSWFRKKPKVVRMELGDKLYISVKVGGTRNILILNEICANFGGPTTATFVSLDQFLT